MAENWKFMKASDAISGKEGALYATINGSVVQVAECKNISAKINKKKSTFNALGYRGEQHKASGWTGSGTLVIHYASSRWIKMMVDYAQNGIDTYFKLNVINEDPTSSIGRQNVTLIDVNLDEIEIAKLDVDAEFLDQSINFTYSGVELTEEFNELNSSTTT